MPVPAENKSVLIVGGGISGITAAVEAAEMVTAYADNLIALFESEMPPGESC